MEDRLKTEVPFIKNPLNSTYKSWHQVSYSYSTFSLVWINYCAETGNPTREGLLNVKLNQFAVFFSQLTVMHYSKTCLERPLPRETTCLEEPHVPGRRHYISVQSKL